MAPEHHEDDSSGTRPSAPWPDIARDEPADILAGWDLDEPSGAPHHDHRDRRPFPTDTVVMVAAALAGVVVAITVGHGRRTTSGAIGALGGAGLAGMLRRIWEAPV